MFKGAIYLLAFFSILFGCATQKIYQPPFPPAPSQPISYPDSTIPELSPNEGDLNPEKGEIKAELRKEEKVVSKLEAPKESLLFPDIAITNLFLSPKRRLVVLIANRGDSSLPLGAGSLRILMDGRLKKIYPLNSLSDRRFLQPKESIPFTTSLKITGRHEIHAYVDLRPEVMESGKENNDLKRILEGPPVGPDITVRDLILTEDLELSIILANGGEMDLRKGVTLRIRIFVNGRKVSEFEHFTSDALKANFANHYIIDPPYRIELSGSSRVRVSVAPKIPADDISLENNRLERTIIIFPFGIKSQGREEFSFSVPWSRSNKTDQEKNLRAEARWDGGGSPLVLSFKGSGNFKSVPAISGKSPLKVEFPIQIEAIQKESLWKVWVTNLMEKKAEGHLIIQHR